MSNTIFIANYIDNLDAISEYLPEFSLKIWNEVYLPDLKTDSIFVFHTGDWNKEFESNRKSMELPSFVNSFFYDLNSLKEKESKINFLAKCFQNIFPAFRFD